METNLSFEENLLNRIETLQQDVQLLRKEVRANYAGSLFLAKVSKVLTKKQAATILSCSERKIGRLIESGHLEVVKIGGSIYITIKSLNEIQTP